MKSATSGTIASEKRIWVAGVLRAIPIVLGYIPVGFAFGVLSQKAGLSMINSLAMSFLVYAGSAQLIAAGLVAAGAPAVSIILTTFIVNLRHMLMSAALSPYLNKWRKRDLAAFSYQLTDETFAVHAAHFAQHVPEKQEVFATNITAQASWVFGTWLGVVAGGLIQDVKPFALDYALPAMFVALLILQVKTRIQVWVAVLTGFLAVGFAQVGMDQWYVIAATILGAAIGVVIESWNKKRSS